MAVSTAYAPLTYSGSGSAGPFTVTWPFVSATDLKVTLVSSGGVETVKTYPTHYTVTGGAGTNGIPGTGAVTMQSGHEPATGATLRIERTTAKTQSTTLLEGGAFQAKSVEAAIDRLMLIAQEGMSGGLGSGISGDVLTLDSSGATDFWDAGAFPVRSSATPSDDTDLVTKAYGDDHYGGAAATAAEASATAAAISATAAEAAAAAAGDPGSLPTLASPDWAADYVSGYDTDLATQKRIPLSAWNLSNTATSFAVKVGSATVATYGILGPNTWAFYPNTTGDMRFGFSETSLQLHYDNIALGNMKTSTVTISNASPGVVTWASHGLSAGMQLAFSTTGALPTGLTAGTRYYVIATGLTANTFQVSATYGGSAVNTSSTGSGVHTAKAITNTSGLTFKIPDFNNSNSGGDHALMNLGVTEGAGTYPYTFAFEGGFAGGTSQSGIGWMVMTVDTAGTSKPRIHVTGKDDNTSVGFGIFGASSEVAGTFTHLHASTGSVSHTHYTTGTTGSTGTDGASVGLWTADQLRVWHYENQPIVFGSNNTEVGRLTTTGLTVGTTLTLKPTYGGTTGIPAGTLIATNSASNISLVADSAGGTAGYGITISGYSGSAWFRGLQYNNKAGTPDLVLQQDGGNTGLGTASPSGKLDVNDDRIRVRTSKTPASAAAAGNAGDVAWDSSYIYVCVATNTWKRAAIATW